MSRGSVNAPRQTRMRRGTFPQAAGRTTPGTTPLLAQPQKSSRRPLSTAVKAGLRSALTGQPLRSPCPISNRNFQQLEIAVTPTKHSPELSLINNKKELFRKIACRAGCLPTIKPALSMQPRRRTATHSTKSHPTNPATSNRQRKGLEIAATPTKHSPELSLIDNKKQLFPKIACRAGCLPAIKPALASNLDVGPPLTLRTPTPPFLIATESN